MNTHFLVLLAVLVNIFGAAFGHEAEKFPPGVPPKGANIEYDIKFHDPNEFAQGGQQQQQQQPGQPHRVNQGRMDRAPKPHRGHHAFGGGKDGTIDIQHEREHMKEHIEEDYIDLDSMTEPQLMAQYFRTFDLDKNGKIDGLEMLKAMMKMDKEHGEGDNSVTHNEIMDMLEELDDELSFYDTNDDGYIYYSEFMRNHRKRIDYLNEE